MTELEIGWLSKVLDLMIEKGCYHLVVGKVNISVFVDSQHPRTCAKCLPKAEEPAPVTQRSGNLSNAEVCQKCFGVGPSCTCKKKQDEPEAPKFSGPIEIGTGPDGSPMPILDPDLFGLGKSTE